MPKATWQALCVMPLNQWQDGCRMDGALRIAQIQDMKSRMIMMKAELEV